MLPDTGPDHPGRDQTEPNKAADTSQTMLPPGMALLLPTLVPLPWGTALPR